MRSRVTLVITVFCFAFLGLISLWTMEEKQYKTFNANTYYVGVMGKTVDPKAQYNLMYNNLYTSEVQCTTELSVTTTASKGNKYWLTELFEFPTQSELQGMNVVQDDTYFEYRLFSEDSKIISPAQCTFLNSNVDLVNGAPGIVMLSGGMYKIEILNIKSWFCHMNKENKDKHSMIIGKNGEVPSVSAGNIIGVAKGDTTVRFYKRQEDNTFKNISIEEYYGIN